MSDRDKKTTAAVVLVGVLAAAGWWWYDQGRPHNRILGTWSARP
jgi:hypothetical protein